MILQRQADGILEEFKGSDSDSDSDNDSEASDDEV